MKPLNEHTAAAEPKLSRALENAWKAALELTGCVQCAGHEIVRRVSMKEATTDQWIIGEQPDDEAAVVPQARNGISRTCTNCTPV